MKLRKAKKKQHIKQQQKQKIKKDKVKKKKKKKVDNGDEKADATMARYVGSYQGSLMVGSPRVIEDIPEIVSTILPDLEILPEVHASKPSWLMRRSRTPSPADKDDTKRQQPAAREPYLPSKTDKVSWHLFKN